MNKMKGLIKTRAHNTDNSMGITRGQGRVGEVVEGKVGVNGDGRRLDLGW